MKNKSRNSELGASLMQLGILLSFVFVLAVVGIGSLSRIASENSKANDPGRYLNTSNQAVIGVLGARPVLFSAIETDNRLAKVLKDYEISTKDNRICSFLALNSGSQIFAAYGVATCLKENGNDLTNIPLSEIPRDVISSLRQYYSDLGSREEVSQVAFNFKDRGGLLESRNWAIRKAAAESVDSSSQGLGSVGGGLSQWSLIPNYGDGGNSSSGKGSDSSNSNGSKPKDPPPPPPRNPPDPPPADDDDDFRVPSDPPREPLDPPEEPSEPPRDPPNDDDNSREPIDPPEDPPEPPRDPPRDPLDPPEEPPREPITPRDPLDPPEDPSDPLRDPLPEDPDIYDPEGPRLFPDDDIRDRHDPREDFVYDGGEYVKEDPYRPPHERRHHEDPMLEDEMRYDKPPDESMYPEEEPPHFRYDR